MFWIQIRIGLATFDLDPNPIATILAKNTFFHSFSCQKQLPGIQKAFFPFTVGIYVYIHTSNFAFRLKLKKNLSLSLISIYGAHCMSEFTYKL